MFTRTVDREASHFTSTNREGKGKDTPGSPFPQGLLRKVLEPEGPASSSWEGARRSLRGLGISPCGRTPSVMGDAFLVDKGRGRPGGRTRPRVVPRAAHDGRQRRGRCPPRGPGEAGWRLSLPPHGLCGRDRQRCARPLAVFSRILAWWPQGRCRHPTQQSACSHTPQVRHRHPRPLDPKQLEEEKLCVSPEWDAPCTF